MFTKRISPDNIQDIIGSEISDKGFMSTSLVRAVAEQFSSGLRGEPRNQVLFRIHVPKGSTGSPLSFFRFGEDEFLLPRNSKIGILNAFRGRDQLHNLIIRIDAELLK